MRGLIVLLCLYTCSTFAESRTVEVCKPGSSLIQQINDGDQDEYLINARHYLQEGRYPVQAARREALAAVLADHETIINAPGGLSFNILFEMDHDGAVLTRAPGGTMHDCITIQTGDGAWRRLSAAGLTDQ